jgi:hypothetical protein
MSATARSKMKWYAKRIMFAVMIPVLLLMGYVTSYVCVCWADMNGYSRLVGPFVKLYAPLDAYGHSGLPLSVELDTLSFWAEAGGRVSLSEMYPRIRELHAEARQREQSSVLNASPD